MTNDDGIHGPGLTALVSALRGRGYDVVVIAPREDGTGCGAGIGPVHRNLTVGMERARMPGLEDVPAFAVDGTPALCVFAGCLGALDHAPDIVVSGINAGPNVGGSVLHSGTVAGPLTGANLGLRGIAVSLASVAPTHWRTAAVLATEAVAWIASAPPQTVLNLNVPDRRLEELEGIVPATLAPLSRLLGTALEEQDDGRLAMRLVPRTEGQVPGSDAALLAAGFATVSVLACITASSPELAAAAAGSLSGLRSES